MRSGWVVVMALAGCVSVPPSSDVLTPARVATAAPAVVAPVDTDAPVAEPAPEAPAAAKPDDKSGFDFEGDDRDPTEKADPKAAPLSPAEMAAGLGIIPAAPASPAGAAPSAPAAPPMLSPMPSFDANLWGVRLVSTVIDATPPRAILGLAGGREIVVTPGQLVPEARVIVLAIGRDRVQVAEVTPEGDHATVRTTMIEALYPGAAPMGP
jgi:hypothetical protein